MFSNVQLVSETVVVEEERERRGVDVVRREDEVMLMDVSVSVPVCVVIRGHSTGVAVLRRNERHSNVAASPERTNTPSLPVSNLSTFFSTTDSFDLSVIEEEDGNSV